MLGSEGLLVDGERAAHQRLGLAETVGGLEQLGQVREVCGDLRMVGSEALLVDGKRTAMKRLGFAEPVGGLEQLGQVVEANARKGCSGPKLFSSMADARAHPRRCVA